MLDAMKLVTVAFGGLIDVSKDRSLSIITPSSVVRILEVSFELRSSSSVALWFKSCLQKEM
jgi:hypothetical protein